MNTNAWPEQFGNQSYNDSQETDVRGEVNRFGDGYRQFVPNGINYINNKMTLRFMRRNDIIREMERWIRPRLKGMAVRCAFPDSEPGLYTMESMKKVWNGPRHSTIEITFEQSFNMEQRESDG